ncbi:MAG TPA: NAD(P)/FAD-dependent oxidoreductase [Ktedonobacterales bacterium]|nr:NAD(P)/FAD-dependent oxidoreductase [Ktedonobacterales bacterium]
MDTKRKDSMTIEHLDVLIVGAGLSGIGTAYYLQTRCPQKRYAILEGRKAIGGTWDLFRYPGIRSDSDMYTLGYDFRPWQDKKAIADGSLILSYIRETAAEFGIDQQIRFDHRVRRATWSSADALWTVEAACGPNQEIVRFTCNFLCMCTGYYDYAQGYSPQWPGLERFAGRVVHPQQWPEELDYAGKQIVVIGSGATAVTLVPALAEQAAHTTMLQRSPTYIVARPSEDALAQRLHKVLPGKFSYHLVRWRSILLGIYFYNLMRRRPEAAKQAIIRMAQKQLGPDYDVGTHFTPVYNPWDQRLCLAPDGDLFRAITSGNVSMVTDQIETFTEQGIRLRSGQELAADIIVTATGLNMRLMSGVQLVVDEVPIDLAKTLSYKGMMYSDIPNLASAFGYTNASWTLKSELIAQYICRLLNFMDRHGYAQCTPRRQDRALAEDPVVPLTSGYVQRAVHTLPRQGSHKPWKMYQNYVRDLVSFRFNSVNDGTMEFTPRAKGVLRQAGEATAYVSVD